jgi:superkiller protein 3
MRAGNQVRDDILFRSGLALGKLYVRSGRHDKAIYLIKNVIASAPKGAALDDAYNTLGLALYYDRLYDEAIFELRKAIKLNPGNVTARFNLKTIRARLEHFQAGKIYARMGDRGEAIAQFRRAIDLDPRFVEARHRLGVALMEVGKNTEALRELRRADSISNRYRKAHEIWYAEGIALRHLGQNGEALELFQKTVQAKPAFAAAHNQAGEILLQQEKYDQAILHFVKAIGSDPRTEYVRNLQITFQKKGK